MPVARDPQLPQINAGQALYGSIPVELLPDGTEPLQFPIWDGVQWRLVTLVALAGIDIELDTVADTLSIVNADYRIAASYTADAVLLKAAAATFTANAVKLKVESRTFTADAVLV